MSTIEPVAAFCSSDEDTEDVEALQFLPIAPEVEEPEEGWGAPPPSGNVAGGGLSGGNQVDGDSHSKENTSPVPKKRKYRSFDIPLEGSPCEGLSAGTTLKCPNI